MAVARTEAGGIRGPGEGRSKPAREGRCPCPPWLTTPSSAGAQGRPLQDQGRGAEGLGRVHTHQPEAEGGVRAPGGCPQGGEMRRHLEHQTGFKCALPEKKAAGAKA